MAELVREIMIDATPETIWPFLIDPGKHIEWDGNGGGARSATRWCVPRAGPASTSRRASTSRSIP